MSEWLWKMYLIYVMLGCSINIFGTCLVSTIWCFHIYGHFEADFIFRPYKMVFPWSFQSPLGYFVEVIYDVIISEAYFIANGALILLFISLCVHHRAFLRCFKLFTCKLDLIQTNGRKKSNKKPDDKKKALFELIRFHVSIKSFFLESAQVYSPHIAVVLIFSTLMMACDVFHIDLQIKDIDSRIIIVLIGFFCGLSNLFVYCYFGKVANESFSEMNDCLYESNWHNLPLDLQKWLPLLIKNTQKPIFYHGFGVAVLQLETLQKLLKTVFTYYMTLKATTTR
ncbi:odorant receptor 82a-like [Sitodiplosis mosellana]|uniref:odorant receptor 82a-like n=1 Tax=Sitodiplosis mosellana TaxID=263140 RepID=UPI002444F490|nr:odorant receptor 82a-like [Sitodiplosis mosellana]